MIILHFHIFHVLECHKYGFQFFFNVSCVCFFEQVDCVRKYVLVGNPVVSLDNMSVFAIKERQEEIAKNRVRIFTL